MTADEVGRCPRCHGPLEPEQVGTGRGHGIPAGWCDQCRLVVIAPHPGPELPTRADLA